MTRHIIRLAIAACALLPPLARADTRDEVMARIQRCAAIGDDRTWLDCMYGAQQPMRAKLGLPPASDYQQRLVPSAPAPYQATTAPIPARPGPAPTSTPAVAPQRRGTIMQQLGGSAPPVAVARLTALTYDGTGAFIATLDNGQVWHQVNALSGIKTRIKPGTKVAITPGALWSYNLKADGDSHAYKVEQRH